MAGLPDDAQATPEFKATQREFLRAVYRLVTGRDRGPRLPTLLISVGSARVRALLGGV